MADSEPVLPGITTSLQGLADALGPTRDEYDRRIDLIARVKASLRHVYKVQRLDVIPYGSFVSGFYNSFSDLDLAVTGYYETAALPARARAEIFRGGLPEATYVPLDKLDRQTKANLLRDISKELSIARISTKGGTEHILHARVPIIKFTDRMSGIECDLCLANNTVGFKAWLVGQVASIHPAFGALFRVVKAWAKAHGINDGAAHSFNSWCLTLVVVFFLQKHTQPALLPPLYQLLYHDKPEDRMPRLLQEGGLGIPQEVYTVVTARAATARAMYEAHQPPPLHQLFLAFVRTFGQNLRALLANKAARNLRLSVFHGDYVPRAFDKPYMLLVEDPLDATDNPARTFGTWHSDPGTLAYISSVFSSAESVLGGQPERPLPVAMALLFGPDLPAKAPDLARHLYGVPACSWVRGEALAQRPSCEIHAGLLQRLGSHEKPLTFDVFKRQNKVRVLNESKYKTAGELGAEAVAKELQAAGRRARNKEDIPSTSGGGSDGPSHGRQRLQRHTRQEGRPLRPAASSGDGAGNIDEVARALQGLGLVEGEVVPAGLAGRSEQSRGNRARRVSGRSARGRGGTFQAGSGWGAGDTDG